MPKYAKVIYIIQISIVLLLSACSYNGAAKLLDLPGITITYPITLLQGSCGAVTLEIGEDLKYFSELSQNNLTNAANRSPGEEYGFVIKTHLVMPGVYVDPAGTVIQSYVDGSTKSFSWEICPSSSGNFNGTVWVYGYAAFGDTLNSEEEPIGAYQIEVRVIPVPNYLQSPLAKILVIIISVVLIGIIFIIVSNNLRKIIGKK